MKAIRFHEYGDASVLRLDDIPKPEPGPDEVLVRVQAAGVNPIDWKVRAGMMKAVRPYTLPLIPGWDVAGTVEAAGPMARFQAGDTVFGRTDGARDGTYAEYICARSDELAHAPATLTAVEAAAVPLAALTAWMCLFDKLRLRAGQRVLVHAGAGGVGGFAVQLAHRAGALVAATCSARNAEYVRSLGADEVIDHTAQDFAAQLSNLDAVLDAVGGDVQSRSYATLRHGGRLVSIAGPIDEAGAAARGVRAERAALGVNGARCADLASLLDHGQIRVEIARVFPLDQAADAHRLSETGHVRGKIVLQVS